jgi:polyisoprenoid-binding protein YceI
VYAPRVLHLIALFVALPLQAPVEAAPPAPAAPAAPAIAGARTYPLDVKKSLLVVQVFKEGAMSALAQDHAVHATELSGSIVADASSPKASSVNVVVQTKTIINDDPKMRTRYGLPLDIAEGDRASIGKTMRGPEVLDVEKHPTISFQSTSVDVVVEPDGKSAKGKVTGDFTLRGVTKKLTIPVTVTLGDGKDGANTIDAKGSVRFKGSDWGMAPLSMFLGGIKNKDELLLHVHLVGSAP